MLPEYCIYTNLFRQQIPGGNNEERIKHYQSLMGPTVSGKPEFLFETMHHYCWALMKTNRGVRLAKTNGFSTAVQSSEVRVELEWPAFVRANDFIDAIAELKTAILD